MVRITVVIFMLSSTLLAIEAGVSGMHQEPQIYNMTHLEFKRSPMIEEKKEKIDCDEATYKTVSLYDFIYKHYCFPPGWEDFLRDIEYEIKENLSPELFKQGQWHPIEPPMPDVFKAFTVPLTGVRVVILGQDPTPQPDKATGLAFSLKPGQDPREVPSVFNMLVELKWEGMNVGLSNGDLTPWVGQGVLLLNSALTVRRGTTQRQAGSHQKLWSEFTKTLVKFISDVGPPSAWLLWGAEAQKFQKFIARPKHMIKAGAHPRQTTGFFGRNYFQCANEFLVKNQRVPVKWKLSGVPGSFAKYIEKCETEGIGEF